MKPRPIEFVDRLSGKPFRGFDARTIAELRRYFERSGYARTPRPKDAGDSHRGYEIRFGAHDAKEIKRIVRLLRRAGIEPGKPFVRIAHYRIPVYGVRQIRRLLGALGQPAERAIVRGSPPKPCVRNPHLSGKRFAVGEPVVFVDHDASRIPAVVVKVAQERVILRVGERIRWIPPRRVMRVNPPSSTIEAGI